MVKSAHCQFNVNIYAETKRYLQWLLFLIDKYVIIPCANTIRSMQFDGENKLRKTCKFIPSLLSGLEMGARLKASTIKSIAF